MIKYNLYIAYSKIKCAERTTFKATWQMCMQLRQRSNALVTATADETKVGDKNTGDWALHSYQKRKESRFNRRILSITVDQCNQNERTDSDLVGFVEVRLHGMSFVMHQIRKIIGGVNI